MEYGKGNPPKKGAGVETGLSFTESLKHDHSPGDNGEGQRPTNKGTTIKR